MKRLIERWQLTSIRVASGVLAFALVGFFLVFRLVFWSRLKATPAELQSTLHGWHAIGRDPLNAPYFALLRVVRYFNHTLFDARLVSVVLALVLCVLLYYVLRNWLNYRLATIGVILFGTNSYFLYIGRLATPAVLQMFVGLGLVALWTASHRNESSRLRWLWALALPIMLYVPGAVWLVAAALLVSRKRWTEAWWRQTVLQKLLLVFASLLLLAPLAYHLVTQTLAHRNVIALEAWAGIGQHGRLEALKGFFKTFVLTPVHLFGYNGIGITSFPAFGIATSSLVLLGLLITLRRRHDRRWGFALSMVAAAWIAVALGGMEPIVLVPLLYLLAAVGLAYLLSEWYSVFPRNPIARTTGFLLISALVVLSCVYNLRVYFVAGPHTTVGRQFICPVRPPQPHSCPHTVL